MSAKLIVAICLPLCLTYMSNAKVNKFTYDKNRH